MSDEKQHHEEKSLWQKTQESYEAERLKLIIKGQRGQWHSGRISSEKLSAEVAKYPSFAAWLMAQPEFKRFLTHSHEGKRTKRPANTNAKPTKTHGRRNR